MTHDSSSKLAKQLGSVHLEIDGTTAHVVASAGTGDAGPLFHAIEDTAHQELERAKRLRGGVLGKLDALAKQDADLEAHVKTDFAKYGGMKQNDVASELASAHDVLAKLKVLAESEARESEDFVADLGRALETASEEKAARAETRHKKKHDEVAPSNAKPVAQASDQTAAAPKAPSPPKAAEKVAEKPAEKVAVKAPEKPAEKAAEKPAETGEVFTP